VAIPRKAEKLLSLCPFLRQGEVLLSLCAYPGQRRCWCCCAPPQRGRTRSQTDSLNPASPLVCRRVCILWRLPVRILWGYACGVAHQGGTAAALGSVLERHKHVGYACGEHTEEQQQHWGLPQYDKTRSSRFRTGSSGSWPPQDDVVPTAKSSPVPFCVVKYHSIKLHRSAYGTVM